MKQWETVIGLEVHVELLTDSKLFCQCSTQFGAQPNTHICPICLGHPGVLPVLNTKAVEYSIKAGLALDCKIPSTSKFDRKHYFYPDMVKNYQISQYEEPLCVDGHVDVEFETGYWKRIRIKRAHLEEDTGKLTHEGDITGSPASLVDFNRSGIPLLEIVTEPDLTSPAEARIFLNHLKTILQYTGVSDCKMEEGSLRCDANISVKPVGSIELGTKTEIKNMNSFRSVERALTFEVNRHIQVLESGGKIVQETRHWDEQAGVTKGMRSKEEAHDYRYFPEPDLVPLVLEPNCVEGIRATLPELPAGRQKRFVGELGLPPEDAKVLVASKGLANFFEEVLAIYPKSRVVSNWVTGELLGALNRDAVDIVSSPLQPGALGQLLVMLEEGVISSKMAKEVFAQAFATGEDPATIVKKQGLNQVSDINVLKEVVEKVVTGNPDSVAAFHGGKDRALGFLIGQVMKETKGQANPQMVNELLLERLKQVAP